MPATQSVPKKSCRHCQSSGPQTYGYMRDRYLYDVDRAHQIVRDGRAPIELDPDDVRYSVENCRIHKSHVPHVNTKYPGIIAHLNYLTDEGDRVHAHILIDGNHRAARCLQLGQPYYVYVLTEDESAEILLRSPGQPCRCAQCLADANA